MTANDQMRASILYATGQGWKFWIAATGGVACIALLVVDLSISLVPVARILLMSMSAILAISSIAFPAISIRCPKCDARWYWQGLKSKHGNGLRLLLANQCPSCGAPSQELKTLCRYDHP